ncbi:MAG: DNA cytosine methyltransferase [Deltaproteobacteria bacterium]|nr:DNA cytosine methyltransferase [Deltaproteobacteria bacterium]
MKVSSLFSGCGGLDLGFQQAGHEIVFAIDNDPDCVDSYRTNLSDAIIFRDVRHISFVPDCDIIIGGPPCQQFSVASRRRKRRECEEGPSILKFARIISINQPRYFLMENVLGLLYQPHSELLQAFLERMTGAGYAVTMRKLDATDFGVPQHRKRLLFYGSLDKIPPPPKQTHSYGLFGESYLTVNDALGWTETKILSQNRSTWKMQEAGKGYFYSSDCPARVITTRGHSICKPPPARLMTVQESAKLQSFPDWFEFKGSIISQRRQIGNAVPPLMAYRIAESFKR